MDNRYVSLMTRLRLPVNGNVGYPKMIGITGIESAREARVVAASVALAAAQDLGDRTLLVDLAGGEASRVTRDGNLAGGAGWDALLAGTAAAGGCVEADPEIDNLFVLSCGDRPLDVRPANFAGIVDALHKLREAHDFVVVLLPPASSATTPALASKLDGILLVFESERTQVERARQAQLVLQDSHARTLGAVLCNWHDHVPAWLSRRN